MTKQRTERFSLSSDKRSLLTIHPQAPDGATVGTVIARIEPWVDGSALVEALNRAGVGALDLSKIDRDWG